jgi:hypothetical protein
MASFQSPSSSLSSFDPAILAALRAMVRAQAPANRVMTFAEVEQAVFDLLQRLGSTLTTEVIADQIAAVEKGGPTRRAAVPPCATSSDERERS